MENNWSWEEYKIWVTENNHNFLFRGQADYQWLLQASLYRGKPIDLNIYVNNIVPEIHNQLTSKGYEFYNLQDINNFYTFLSKLQHHGFPTPLLDWTYNPYIATYFAINDIIENRVKSDYFSIYVFDYVKWISTYYQPMNLLNPHAFVSTFRPFYFNSPRPLTQQSILTATNVINIEQHLVDLGKVNNTTYLYKININKDEIKFIQKDLDQIGITKNFLFPNMDDICLNLKNLFFPKNVLT